MGFLAAIRAWRAARKERLIDERTNRASDLSDDKQYDILMLHERGVIRAKGTGQSITRVHADVENLIRKTLRVTIKPGTYFVARGGHQNMATTAEYSFTLYPCRTEHLSVDAACINAGLPIPTERDHFNRGREGEA